MNTSPLIRPGPGLQKALIGLLFFIRAAGLFALDPGTLNAIQAARKRGDHMAAVSLERQALRNHPDDVDALTELCRDSVRLKHFDDAIAVADRGLELEGRTRKGSEAYLFLQREKCDALVGLGRIDEAIALAEGMLAEYPTHIHSSEAVESVYGGMGRPDDAIRILQQHQLKYPQSGYPSYFSAVSALRKNDWNLAEKYLRQAISINPRKAMFWAWLGDVLYQPLNGKRLPMDEGIRVSSNSYCAYQHALAIDPKNTRALDGVQTIKENFEISALANLFSGGVGGGGDECPQCHGSGQVWRNSPSGNSFYRCDACDGTGHRR